MEFVPFPETPYVYDGVPRRGDRQLSQAETDALWNKELILQEKVDGTNIGLRLDSGVIVAQHRGDIIRTDDKESRKLREWCRLHMDELTHILGNHSILFGEWMLFKHTIVYNRLPSYFLAFDMYDLRRGQFLSQDKFRGVLSGTGIHTVPTLHEGVVGSIEELRSFITCSRFGSDRMEGLYIRVDYEGGNGLRCKYVPPEFQQSLGIHWRKRSAVMNSCVDSVEQYWSR